MPTSSFLASLLDKYDANVPPSDDAVLPAFLRIQDVNWAYDGAWGEL